MHAGGHRGLGDVVVEVVRQCAHDGVVPLERTTQRRPARNVELELSEPLAALQELGEPCGVAVGERDLFDVRLAQQIVGARGSLQSGT